MTEVLGSTTRPKTADRLRCDCGRVVACPPADVVRYAEEGRPRCCGEVMSLSDRRAVVAPDR